MFHLNRGSGSSLQEQIFEQIRLRILDGSLKKGAALPSSRMLAGQLKVSRKSVIHAYALLIDEGYVVTRRATGTFVASNLPDLATARLPDHQRIHGPEILERLTAPAFSGRRHAILNNRRTSIDFWPQRTDPRAFPRKIWRRLVLQALATAGHSLTEYGDPCGLMELRSAIAELVHRNRGINVQADQVVIVAGAQLALNLALRVLSRVGDGILVENPCSQGAAYLFESLKMRLHHVDVDAQGMQTSHLSKVVDARIAYVMPTHHFPLGGMLSLSRRHSLIQWAERHGAYIIEDDYDSEFHHDAAPLPAIKALSPENTVYLGTFSKSLGAGLRTGYAIFPKHLSEMAKTAKALLDNGHVWLEQAALAEFLSSGGFARHLRRVRISYQRRRDRLVRALDKHFPGSQLMGAQAGTHLAWKPPAASGPLADFYLLARRSNIGIYGIHAGGGHEYGGNTFESRWLLLGYAALSEDQIEAGIQRLASVVKSRSTGR